MSNTTETTAPAARLCRCNCGAEVQGKKSVFRPGHDARVVGLMARDIAQGDLVYTNHILLPALTAPLARETDIQANIDDATQAVGRLFSQPLALKFNNACHTAWAKAVNKDAKPARAARAPKDKGILTPAPQVVDPAPFTVKVGRWEYPAKTQGGQSFRNTKRDGSGEWVPFVQK